MSIGFYCLCTVGTSGNRVLCGYCIERRRHRAPLYPQVIRIPFSFFSEAERELIRAANPGKIIEDVPRIHKQRLSVMARWPCLSPPAAVPDGQHGSQAPPALARGAYSRPRLLRGLKPGSRAGWRCYGNW